MHSQGMVLGLLAATSLIVSSGCKSKGSEPTKIELSVFAASSLTEAFRDLEGGFEATHPGVDVQLTFAGSQVLRLQIEEGAAVDVFASANESHMKSLVDAGHVNAPRVFARNELVVIVPASNPAGLETFADLGEASRIVLGTAHVPVGIYARQVLDRAATQLGDEFVAQVRKHVVSEESNVRLVRAKVEMGEADAAVVYRTDAVSSSRARLLPIPDELNALASYPIGTSTSAPHPREAEQFVAYVLSSAGRAVLRRRGFVVPK